MMPVGSGRLRADRNSHNLCKWLWSCDLRTYLRAIPLRVLPRHSILAFEQYGGGFITTDLPLGGIPDELGADVMRHARTRHKPWGALGQWYHQGLWARGSKGSSLESKVLSSENSGPA